MSGFILNATSIKVNWTTSSETNGYVIEYTTGGVTRNVVSTSEDEIVLTDLSPMSTCTISVYSYIDLPSVNSAMMIIFLNISGKFLILRVTRCSVIVPTPVVTDNTNKDTSFVSIIGGLLVSVVFIFILLLLSIVLILFTRYSLQLIILVFQFYYYS